MGKPHKITTPLRGQDEYNHLVAKANQHSDVIHLYPNDDYTYVEILCSTSSAYSHMYRAVSSFDDGNVTVTNKRWF